MGSKTPVLAVHVEKVVSLPLPSLLYAAHVGPFRFFRTHVVLHALFRFMYTLTCRLYLFALHCNQRMGATASLSKPS